jgi:hypothetical protein
MTSPLIGLILDADGKEISVFDILIYVNPTIYRYVNARHLLSVRIISVKLKVFYDIFNRKNQT